MSDATFLSAGVLEMYLKEDWVVVCELGQREAEIACRQLGFHDATSFGSEPDSDDIFSDMG